MNKLCRKGTGRFSNSSGAGDGTQRKVERREKRLKLRRCLVLSKRKKAYENKLMLIQHVWRVGEKH